MVKKYLTPDEVQEIIGIRKKTLANWRSKGKGPKYSKLGKIIRYAVEEIERWMRSCQVRTTD